MKLKSVAEALQCSPTLIRSWGIQQRAIGSFTPLPKRQRHSERAKADRSLPTLRETAGSGVRAGGALKHQIQLPVIKQSVKSIYTGHSLSGWLGMLKRSRLKTDHLTPEVPVTFPLEPHSATAPDRCPDATEQRGSTTRMSKTIN